MKKRMLALVMAGMMALSMTACGPQKTESDTNTTESAASQDTNTAGNENTNVQTEGAEASVDETEYRIGVLQLVQHSALDASYAGFLAALNDAGIKYVVD